MNISDLLKDLTKTEKLLLLKKVVGFEEEPVSIEQFYSDDYYLGRITDNGKGVYNVWKEALNIIYPDNVTTKTFVCLNGAIRCLSGDNKVKVYIDEKENEPKILTIKELFEFNQSTFGSHNIHIVSYNKYTNKYEYGLIDKVHYTGTKKVCNVRIKNINTNTITNTICSYEHLFLTDEGFIEAQYLHNNQLLKDKIHIVENVKYINEEIDTYDITVFNYHNYCILDCDDDYITVHNTGKSNTSKIMILYDIYKYCCLGKNIYKYFELIPRPFFVGISHETKEKAQANVNELWEWIEASPWFQEQMANENSLFNQFEIKAVRSPDDFIGRNMCCFWGTELNFFDLDRGTKLINSAISRIEGTFNKGFDMFVHIILDSSDTTNDSVVPYFLQKHPFGRRAIQFKYSIFDAKPHLYYHIEDKLNIDDNKTRFLTNGREEENPYYGYPRRTFRVYKGDTEIHPCILEPYGEQLSKNIYNKMDRERFLDVPLELLDSARADIELFLQEKCGQSVESTNQYFNPKYVVPHWVLPNLVHTQDSMEPADIIQVDFFGADSYIDLLREAVYTLPKDRCIFGRLDLGIANDRAGLSIGYVQDVGLKDEDGVVTYDPKIIVPISVGISRYAGQETSIEKLTDLIQWIHSIVPFYEFTTDTFQSFAIKQKLTSANINARFLSVDRTKTAYQLTKNFFYRDKLDIVQNKVLKTELLNVYDTGDKIDHHDTMNEAMEIGSDSKDIADSLVGLVQSIFECINEDVEGVMTPPIISNSQHDRINKEFIDYYEQSERMKSFINQRRMNFGR